MNETPIGQEQPLLDTRYGKISTPQDNDLITKFLRSDGEWAFLEAEFVASHLPGQARVLDIGAYLGTFTLGLAQFTPLSFACLAEGNPNIAPHLENNIALNLNCRHEVLNAVIVDPSIPIGSGHGDPNNNGSTSFVAQSAGAVLVQEPLATMGFESLVNQHGPFDLVKADVEGMEEQLLASYPALLHASTPLLWVECNETPAVMPLARLLLSTGRPLTYFAWPSHNPENHNGNKEPIFPFAYEAGLLLGAEPRALTASQQAAGCILRRISSVEDLKQSLWLTPRWAPREWTALSRHEIVGVAEHILTGHRYETFLNSVEADEHEQQPSKYLAVQLARHRIRQLEDTVIELASALRQVQTLAAKSAAKEADDVTEQDVDQINATPPADAITSQTSSVRHRISRCLSSLKGRIDGNQ
jgi:FkbM family methyltransferase